MLEIKVEKIDNGFLVKAEYGYEVVNEAGQFMADSIHFAGSMDEVRDRLAHIGIKLQTAKYAPSDEEL